MTPLKLLVVEDDPASLELMAEVFTSLKANVRAVSDSQHAAGLVNQERFDGIFLDLEMPNLHGFDLARLIRRSSWNKSAPIIIVTGRDEPGGYPLTGQVVSGMQATRARSAASARNRRRRVLTLAGLVRGTVRQGVP